MGRLLGIDYGRKRVGIAVTDPGQMIASGLTTVGAHEVLNFIKSYLEKEDVDIVLSDINMPHLNGLEMLKEIKALKDDQTVVFLSAHHEKGYVAEASKMGVDYFIHKPINLDEFTKVLYDSAKHALSGLKG